MEHIPGTSDTLLRKTVLSTITVSRVKLFNINIILISFFCFRQSDSNICKIVFV